MHRWRQEFLRSKWPHINEQIALRKIFTAKNVTEQRNVGTISYKMKCKMAKPGYESGTEVEGRVRMRLYVGLKDHTESG